MESVPSLEVVIPSKQRPDTVGKAAVHFKNPIICIDEDEEESYRAAVPNARLLLHPRCLNRLLLIRQWILETVKADIIFQCDDDVHEVFCISGHRERKLQDPETIEAIIRNVAINAREAGTVIFYFSGSADPREYRSLKPFRLTGVPVGCATGYWREDFNREIRYDAEVKIKGNIDIGLKTLAVRRIIWCDSRFCFRPKGHFTNQGGIATYRTIENMEADIKYLKSKYGDVFKVDHFTDNSGKGGRKVHFKLNVKRTGKTGKGSH